jgi:ATP-binding protein involved in chromosome partitioning
MGIKKIIAFGSAKGGVGKSSITASIAIGLSKKYKVGILDADIYGPNQDILFQINEKPDLDNTKSIIPIKRKDIEIVSMGFILDSGTSATWRGPMLSGAIKQIINSSKWGNLDFLLIDMPPGTGDSYLTIFNELSVDHFILITSSNKLSISDSRRTISMLNKLEINILGYIENDILGMSNNKTGNLFFKENINNLGIYNFNKNIYDFNPDYNNPDNDEIITILEKII